MWRVCEPTPIRYGPHTLVALGPTWGGNDSPYQVFTTDWGILLPVAECAFDCAGENGNAFRHVVKKEERC